MFGGGRQIVYFGFLLFASAMNRPSFPSARTSRPRWPVGQTPSGISALLFVRVLL